MTVINNIIEELQDQIADKIEEARKEGYEKAHSEALETQISSMTFNKGDVVILKKTNLSRRTLESIRIQLQSKFKIAGIIVIEEDSEISKLSDINLGLLCLQRKK